MIDKKIYDEVWMAMDACNSSGVIHDLSKRWVEEIWNEARELGKGTDYVNSHPIIVIVLDKLLQLAEKATPQPIDASLDSRDHIISKAYQAILERKTK